MYYDPTYYEYQANWFIAKMFNTPIQINVRLPDFSVPFHRRNELDGLLIKNDEEIPIEIKSFPLSKKDVEIIQKKYKKMHFYNIIIVAPKVPENINYAFSFIPNEKVIRNFYENWSPNLTEGIISELANGKHHFRYKLLRRSEHKNTRFLNQVDKRIKSIETLKKDILRTPKNSPPVRVYWSTHRWLDPKGLYYKNQRSYILGGLLVFDIDGSKIHKSYFDCVINKNGLCEYCFRYAKIHTQRLLNLLQEESRISNLEVWFSGRQGFHIYAFSDTYCDSYYRKNILDKIIQEKIIVDDVVTSDQKRIITFPGTLHAYSLRKVQFVKNLKNFRLNMVNYETNI